MREGSFPRTGAGTAPRWQARTEPDSGYEDGRIETGGSQVHAESVASSQRDVSGAGVHAMEFDTNVLGVHLTSATEDAGAGSRAAQLEARGEYASARSMTARLGGSERGGV